MRISAKIDYASRALLELSLHWPSATPLRVHTIAERQKIPIRFLTQILIALKELDYVQSIRGKKGGYLLAQKPVDIQLDEVISAFDTAGDALTSYQQNGNEDHVMACVWREIDAVTQRALSNVNFETIRNRKLSSDKIVMFEI